MVEWTAGERKIINDIFSTLDYDDIGPKALSRCLIVYPWCQRYFGAYGDLSTAENIKKNKKIAAHGIKVLHGLDLALKNMDSIKTTYSALSTLHSDKLHVDPDNFKLFSQVLTVVISGKMGDAFTADVQCAFQKFLSVVVSALGRQYH